MDKKFDFKSLIEDKGKLALIGIMALIVIGVVFYLFSIMQGDEEKEVIDFSNPEADLVEYNNKLEAITGKKEQESVNDLEYTFANANDVENENKIMPNFENLDRQLAQMGNPVQQEQSLRPANNVATNNHDVYGDYNMWQTSEPQKSNIGYSNTQNRPRVVKSKEIRPKYQNVEEEEIPISSVVAPTESFARVEPVQKKGLTQAIQVPAQLISQGYMEEGRMLSFAIKEPITIAGQKLPKNFVIQGRSQIQDNRVMVKFSAIKFNNKLYPVQINLLDSNGLEGLGISGGDEKDSSESLGRQVVSQGTNRIPIVGGIIGGVINNKGNKSSVRRIKLQPAQVYLMINE